MAQQIERRSFHSNKTQQKLFRWWSTLEDRKGPRARLRRCKSPSGVLFQQEFFRFFQSLDQPEHLDRKKLACVGGLLSHVRDHAEDQRLAKRMGQTKGNTGRPVVSEARFRRLLHYEQPNELFRPMIRILRLLDYTVPLNRFAMDIYYWDREKTREDLAFDYYETIPLEG